MNTFERLTTTLAPLFSTQGVNTMAITTLAAVKSYLGIADTSKDVQITALIPYVEQVYLDIRNAPWELNDQGAIVYPSGSDVTAADMIGYKLTHTYTGSDSDLQSETIGSYSYSKDTGSARFKGFPSNIVSSIKKYIRGE